MTINIALVTPDAIILGCDSIASTTEFLVDPFELTPQKDEDGKIKRDDDGKLIASVDFSKGSRYVTNVWSGVTKMFQISESPPIAGVTTGIAALHGRTITSLANEFLRNFSNRKNKLVNVQPIANAFFRYLKPHYAQHNKDRTTPRKYWDNLEFLIGGFGKNSEFPSLHRVKLREETVEVVYDDGKYGVAWGGQAIGVHRLLLGYDTGLAAEVEGAVDDLLSRQREQMNAATVRIISEVLNKLERNLPEGVDTSLPSKVTAKLPWDQSPLAISYSSLPLQDAIDLVGWLVNIESGRQKFTSGIATVGGRTRVGVLTRDGFEEPQEPELQHRLLGFPDDL